MKTEDVTDLFQDFREHARHLRNTAFDTRDVLDWDIIEDFEAVSEVLFERLVLYRVPHSPTHNSQNWKDSSYFLIEPSGEYFPIMISRSKGRSGYWDHEIKMLKKDDAVIAFNEYFDWDQQSRIDLQYYYGVIISSETYPELGGHHALIETNHAKIRINQKEAEQGGAGDAEEAV